MKHLFAGLFAIAFACIGLAAEPEAPPCCPTNDFAAAAAVQAQPKAVRKFARGRKAMSAEMRAHYHAKAKARHGRKVMGLKKATQAQFDCRTAFGNVLPTDDQGQCGDCFGVSSTDGSSMALILAGILPNDTVKGRLSSQYGLDNSGAFQGGCGGGDEAQVIDFIMTTGFPLTSDYGPYQQSPQNNPPSTANMKFYKIANYGYCTPNQEEGFATVQDIKNCMAQYGPISVAFDASECDSYVWPGTMCGNGQGVDHAVLMIGWDDNHDNGDGSKGAWLGMNQWGQASNTTVTFDSQPWGGPNGTFWIKYGADSFGTEAIWMQGSTTPIPTPVPPGPTPPPGPAPETFSVVIPAQTITFAGPLGKTYSATVPSQTVMGTIVPPANLPVGRPQAAPVAQGGDYSNGQCGTSRPGLLGRFRRR